MHSPDGSRHGRRRRPELNINTSTINGARDVAPSTPPARKPSSSAAYKPKPPVSSRALNRLPTPALPTNRDHDELSLVTSTPDSTANKENEPDFARGRNPRDSHDLSLRVTRDSLVANMLLSLDQYSLGQIRTPTRTAFDDSPFVYGEEQPRAKTAATTPSRSGRMHSQSVNHSHHGYADSSDLDGADDGASRLSSQFSRGRRSDSSSGLQSSLGRINSKRETIPPANRPTTSCPSSHSRGGRTSKTSSTNSVDVAYAQIPGRQRHGHGFRGRSSSFDLGQQLPSSNSPKGWPADSNTHLWTEDYEAAPTPTIPAGPRRLPPPVMTPPPPLPPPPPPPKAGSPDRKKTARPRNSITGRAAQSTTSGFDRELPHVPTPDMEEESAPAPHVGYGKSKEPPPGGTASKDRPGFFRRVFGSSRNLASAFESSSNHVASTSIETIDRPSSKTQHIAPSSPPPVESQHSPHHVIHKKSSFFRRRKRSISEAPPVPAPPASSAAVLPPIDLRPEKDTRITKPDPSPVSSLRAVMNPYLKGSTPSTPNGLLSPQSEVAPSDEIEDGCENGKSTARGFTPDCEPDPRATIRSVQSASATKGKEEPVASSPKQEHVETPSRDPPQVPAPVEKPSLERGRTFFHETSDNEGEQSADTSAGRSPRSGNEKPGHRTNENEIRTPKFSSGKKSPNPEPSPGLPLESHDGHEEQIPHGPAPSLGLNLPLEGPHESGRSSRTSTSKNSSRKEKTAARSASSLPSVQVHDAHDCRSTGGTPFDEPVVSVGEPTEDDRQKARRIFDGNEDFIQKEKAASWMGEAGLVRQRTLRAYLELYDFANLGVLSALRQMCSRLVFRAETQQVDRILVAFAKRWCDCNPNHGFKTADVIHTMCYSIMLLNTDLHLADIDQKMTRSQFVKNTMTTIMQALSDSAPEAFQRPSILPGKSALLGPGDTESRMSVDDERPSLSWRASFRPPPRSESSLGHHSDQAAEVEDCGPLVKAPFLGPKRAWEGQVELVLKDAYTSIRDDRLPLYGAETSQPQTQQSAGLSVMSMIRRSPSLLSRAPSEGQSSFRGRGNDPTRPPPGSRWNSKSRSRPRLAGGFASSRTSFDDGNSMWSPTGSSAAWSRQSLGRTQTSMSMESFGSVYPYGDYQQSIGFANALSQAIIREDGPAGSAPSLVSDELAGAQLLEDESLELAGPPWVKEGIVTHKHHLHGVDKKAKDRHWTEVFAVVQKGSMSLFSFSSKSMRQKARFARKNHPPGGVVGGGNWQENATNLGTFSLRQTLASALPPPGYSRSRPHVWALSLPTGAVHLFQVGTPEISKEFVLTVNYWSARLSTHPLVGGISNIEYGWSDAVVDNVLVSAINNDGRFPPRPGSAATTTVAAGRSSLHSRTGSRQSSLRSSFDVVGPGGGSSSSSRAASAKLPGDRIHIAEWKPPAQSMRASACAEPEQLAVLARYVGSVERDLQRHNELRSRMLLAFTPRGPNAAKAMANWERKSSYLLREIVKFTTYVDSLQHATRRRTEIYREREDTRRMSKGGNDVVGNTAAAVANGTAKGRF